MPYPEWLQAPKNVDLSKISTRGEKDPNGKKISREKAEAKYAENIAALEELQFKLSAESKHKILVVLQAMDTAGKDGAIRKVFGPLNPQGVRVQSFKKPTEKELSHDFLWRVHQYTPETGHIQIFNRSHYEDVLVVRVHNLVPEEQWKKRYDHIRNFEKLLADEGTMIMKFMLHISPEEQKERLENRLKDPERVWKFRKGDLDERKLWSKYQEAYEVAIEETHNDHAPWYIIPADKKWYRNYALSTIMREHLERLDLKWPLAEEGLDEVVVEDL